MGTASRYRLAWMVCSLLLIGFLGNSISSYFVSRDNVRQTITESALPLTSDNIYSEIQRDLLRPIFISSMMANDAFLRDWVIQGEQDLEPMQLYLSEIRREYETVTSFFVSESTRNYYYADGILKQVDPEEPRDVWYFRVREMPDRFEINVDYDMANRDTMTIFVNYRVYDFEGNYLGATGTGLTVGYVNDMIADYQNRYGREIFFTDRDGKIVLGPASVAIYEHLGDIPGLRHAVEGILTQGVESVRYDREGETFFLNSRYIPELDWFLIVEQTENILLAPLRETLWANIGMALLITCLVGLVCVSAINRHHLRLEEKNNTLASAMKKVEHQKELLEQGSRELAQANRSLARLNQEKDEFIGIVAHDLRTPLNGILGFNDEIRANLPPDQPLLREWTQEVRSASMHMLDLIVDILNVEAIESFQGPLQLGEVEWNNTVEASCQRLHPMARRKQITIQQELDATSEGIVRSRERWLSICCDNLLGNAIKFSPPGTTVTVRTEQSQDGFRLHITDQGPGIAPEELPKVFGKFARLSPQPTGGEATTGLGLYIVEKLCLRLNAKVTVTSELGKGTTFTILHPESGGSTV